MTDIARILNYEWPECFREMDRDWDQVEDLQTFLDTHVIWETGQEKTASEILAVEATFDTAVADANAKQAQEVADRNETKQDAVINALLNRTNAEINTWVDANVTNMAEAQSVIKIILKLLAASMKRYPL